MNESTETRVSRARRWASLVMAFLILSVSVLASDPAAAAAPPFDATTNCSCDTGGDGSLTTTGNGVSMDTNGHTGDWDSAVLTDPDNNVCDGTDGNGDDPDAPIQSTGRDITHFAFTWDTPESNSSHIEFFTARDGSVSNTQNFAYYADLDQDGFQESNEPVIGVEWSGNNRNVIVKIYDYNPVDTVDGDCLDDSEQQTGTCDGSGLADGYSPPGTLSNGVCGSAAPFDNAKCEAKTGSTSGIQMEFAVTWADLGQTPGQPIAFHVSSSNATLDSNAWPNQIDDNLGGCGGGLGSFNSYAVSCTGAGDVTGQHGDTLEVFHTVTNDGNTDDVFEISDVLNPAHTCADTPCTSPDVIDYLVDDGDGVFEFGGDDVSMTDSNSDGNVDTGTLAPGASLDFWAYYSIDNVARPYEPTGTATNDITFTSVGNSSATGSCSDDITAELVPEISATKVVNTISDPTGGSSYQLPGSVMEYTVSIQNAGGGSPDTDTVLVTDPIPVQGDLFVGDIGGAGSGPVSFTDGAESSGLSYTFTSLGSGTDDLEFSDDGGSTWTYTPTPDADGFDVNVTHIRLNPKGDFEEVTSANYPATPSFSIKFRMRVQ